MKSGGIDASDVITVLVYVLIFGGAIVAEVVKQLKRKKAEERQREGYTIRRKQTDTGQGQVLETVEEVDGTAEEDVSDNEEVLEDPVFERPMPEARNARELFEQVFGPLKQQREKDKEADYQQELAEMKKEATEVVTQHTATSVPTSQLPSDVKSAGQEPHTSSDSEQKKELLRDGELFNSRIFRERRFSEMQRIIVMAEVIGHPRARKPYIRN